MTRTSSTATAGHSGEFGPRTASALLDRASRQARQEFEPFPPWLLATRAVTALAAFGAIWLTVRGQHPYAYPTAAAAPAGVIVGAGNLIATVTAARRAGAGIRGRSRFRPAEFAIMATVLAAVFTVMAVLAATGVSDSIAYGLYPATVPLIAGGLAWAAITAAHGRRRAAGTAVAIAVVGAVGTLAGPAGAWAVAALGVCAVLLASAAITARQRRA